MDEQDQMDGDGWLDAGRHECMYGSMVMDRNGWMNGCMTNDFLLACKSL